ncbi:MAG: hypothetical protein ABI837_13150 [Acidobacteriota bacterium]
MKRIAVSIAVAGVIAAAHTAVAAEPRRAPEKAIVIATPELQSLVPMTLTELFASVASHTASVRDTSGMITYENPIAEVMIARRNADGTVSRACVETEEAARNFLSASREAVVSSSPEPK